MLHSDVLITLCQISVQLHCRSSYTKYGHYQNGGKNYCIGAKKQNKRLYKNCWLLVGSEQIIERGGGGGGGYSHESHRTLNV